jgi:hypothetical protein
MENRRAVTPGGSHASAVVSGGWEYDRRASEIRQMLGATFGPTVARSPIVINIGLSRVTSLL